MPPPAEHTWGSSLFVLVGVGGGRVAQGPQAAASRGGFQGTNLAHNLKVAAAVAEMAQEVGITPGQLALSWLLSRGEDIVAIAGTKRPARVKENAAAADVLLTPEDHARITETLPPGLVVGDRYPPELMDTLDV